MKKILLILGLLSLGFSTSPANPVGVSFDVFYSSLSPEGEWIQCDGGVYAWRPYGVATTWRPYYNGRWCWTDDGWYWVSSEPWAWATYHYGRWYYDDFYGWVWIPGYDWAPAWVEWRYGGGFIGWAPLSPYAVFSVSFGIHYRSSWITPHSWWSFVDCRYIGDPHMHQHIYRRDDNGRYIGRTRSAGSVRYDGGRIMSRGPDRAYVERRGDIRIERAEIHDVTGRPVDRLVREGGRERVDVYRPRIEEGAANTPAIRPGRVRESGRSIPLDTRNMDIRSRDVDREAGRDLRRAEEYRGRNETQMRRETPSRNPGRQTQPPSYERPRRQPAQRELQPQRETQRRPERLAQPPRRQDSREFRSRKPESPRVDRAPAARSSGGRGGESGSRGSGGRRR